MPVVFRQNGFKFHFYSNEGEPREPPHIHVLKDAIAAKFWLRPEVVVAYNDGFNARTLRDLAAIIESRREEIEQAWHDFFG